jgi:hypothetical protein
MSEDAAPSLRPGLPGPKISFELAVTIPAGDDIILPPVPNMGQVSAELVLRVPVKARDLPEAAVAGLAAAGAWARIPGARAEVRPVPAEGR